MEAPKSVSQSGRKVSLVDLILNVKEECFIGVKREDGNILFGPVRHRDLHDHTLTFQRYVVLDKRSYAVGDLVSTPLTVSVEDEDNFLVGERLVHELGGYEQLDSALGRFKFVPPIAEMRAMKASERAARRAKRIRGVKDFFSSARESMSDWYRVRRPYLPGAGKDIRDSLALLVDGYFPWDPREGVGNNYFRKSVRNRFDNDDWGLLAPAYAEPPALVLGLGIHEAGKKLNSQTLQAAGPVIAFLPLITGWVAPGIYGAGAVIKDKYDSWQQKRAEARAKEEMAFRVKAAICPTTEQKGMMLEAMAE